MKIGKIVLDGNEIKNREQLYASLKKQLNHAECVGSNLDAIYDVLTEQPELPEVELRNWEALHDHLGEYAERLLRMLRDVESEFCRNVCLDTDYGTEYNKVSFDRERQE